MQEKNKVTNAQDMGPEVLGPLGSQKMPFVTLLLYIYKKKYKKVRKHHQRHIHSINPQVNTEKAMSPMDLPRCPEYPQEESGRLGPPSHL